MKIEKLTKKQEALMYVVRDEWINLSLHGTLDKEALNAWLASNGGASASDNCSNVTWTNNFTSVSDTCDLS